MTLRCGMLFVLLACLVCFANSVPVKPSKTKPVLEEKVPTTTIVETEESITEATPLPYYQAHPSAYGHRYNSHPSQEETLSIKPQQRQLDPSEEEDSSEEVTTIASEVEPSNVVTDKYKKDSPASHKVGAVSDKKTTETKKPLKGSVSSDDEEEDSEHEEANEEEEDAEENKKPQQNKQYEDNKKEKVEEDEEEDAQEDKAGTKKVGTSEEENEEPQEDEEGSEKTNTSEEKSVKKKTKSTLSKSSATKTKTQTDDKYGKEGTSDSETDSSEVETDSSHETTTLDQSQSSEETPVQDKSHKLHDKVSTSQSLGEQKGKKPTNKTPSKSNGPELEKHAGNLQLSTDSVLTSTEISETTLESEEIEGSTVSNLEAPKQPLKYGSETSKPIQKLPNGEKEMTEQVRELNHERQQYRLPLHHN